MKFLEELDDLIYKRKITPQEGSYTSGLFQKGLDRILKKVGEEAGEVIIAAKNHDGMELKNEAADLLFHLMITLQSQGIKLKDVVAVLESRNTKK